VTLSQEVQFGAAEKKGVGLLTLLVHCDIHQRLGANITLGGNIKVETSTVLRLLDVLRVPQMLQLSSQIQTVVDLIVINDLRKASLAI